VLCRAILYGGGTMDISKFDKADVLRLLYNNAKPLGMGFLDDTPEDMTKEQV
jgi:hypothetical protein